MEAGWEAMTELACETVSEQKEVVFKSDSCGLKGIAGTMEIGWVAMNEPCREGSTSDAASRSRSNSNFSLVDQEVCKSNSSGLEAIGATMALGWEAIDTFSCETSRDQGSGRCEPFGLDGTAASMETGWGGITVF